MVKLPQFLFKKAPKWALPVTFFALVGMGLLIAFFTGLFDKKGSKVKTVTSQPSEPPVDTAPPDTSLPGGTEIVVPVTDPVDDQDTGGQDDADVSEPPKYYFIAAITVISLLNLIAIALYYGIYKADRTNYPVQETIGFGLWAFNLILFGIAVSSDIIDAPEGRQFALTMYEATLFIGMGNLFWCIYWFTMGFQEKKKYFEQADEFRLKALALYNEFNTPENRQKAQEQLENVKAGIATLQSFYDAYQKGLLQSTYDYTSSQASAIKSQMAEALRSGNPTRIVDTMSNAVSQASNVGSKTKKLLTEAVKEQAENQLQLGPENSVNFVDPIGSQPPTVEFKAGDELKKDLDKIYDGLTGWFSAPDMKKFEQEAKAFLEKEQTFFEEPESTKERDERHRNIIENYKQGKDFR